MALPPFMYEPLVTPRLFGALDPTESLTGGGPAYMTITPDFMPEPAPFEPAPVAAPAPFISAPAPFISAPAPVAAPPPPVIALEPAAPPVSFTPSAMRPLLDPIQGLTSGGPAFVNIARDFMPEPAEGPAPVAMTPQEEFLARVQQVEAMVPSVLPGAMPEQVSVLPSAPEAPPPMTQPTQAISGFEDYERALGSLNPALEYEQSAGRVGGQSVFDPTGLTFFTDRGRPAGYGTNKSGFVAFDPNAQYRMFDERGKNRIVSEGQGEEGLRNIYNLANQFNKEQGKKANWGIERLNPATGQWERILENDPAKNIAGKIADVALPVLGAVVAGPLGAAAGAGLSSVAQGRSLENTLLRAALAGGSAYAGGQLFGPVAGGAAGAKAGSAASSLAGQAAGKVAGQAIIDAAGNMILPVGGSILGSAAASAVGAGAGSLLGSAIGSAPAPTAPEPVQQPAQSAPTNEIVVTAPATASGAPASNYVLGTLLPAIGAANVTPTSPTTPADGEIVVQTNRTPPPLESFAPGLAAGPAVLPDLTKTPVDVPNPAEKNSLLDEIIKYYSLGSGVLDALGGAFGGGGATAAPYTPRLGAMPTFTRGAFTPFAGDYETYGFGPEFNFFGGAPTPIPTAPAMGILPPAAQPGPRLA